MNAIFKKSKYVLSAVFFILTSFLVALFLYMFIKGKMDGLDDTILCTVIIMICCAFGIVPFLYNHKAFLKIDNGKIVGRFGFFKHIEGELSDVVFTMALVDSLHIVFKDRKYYILGIKNPYQLSAYIKRRLSFSPRPVTEDDLIKAKGRKNTLNKHVILIFCMIALAFLWIVLTMLFIEDSKEFSDFTRQDWICFTLLCCLELPTVFFMFFFALSARKGSLGTEKELYEIKRSLMESTPLSTTIGRIEAVLLDVEFFRRITVISGCIENNEHATYFNIEQLDKNFDLKFVYQSEIFENKECVLPFFEELCDITEKFTK